LEVFQLFQFKVAQKSYDIAGITVGGYPGAIPTTLIGSLFYSGHKLVKNRKTGSFDKKKAQQLIEGQDQIAAKTGNPCMLDIVADTPESMKQYLDFVAEHTEAPILIDSTAVDTRIAAIEYATEIGLLNRVIYNSLMPSYQPKELQAIQNAQLKQVILLAFAKQLATTTGRIETICTEEETGLYFTASNAGVTKPLIDTCVIDIPSLGMACSAILQLKTNFGFVCGCGAHNAVETWRGLKTKFRSGLQATGAVSAAVLAATAGADFILYGPIEHASAVFPMVALVDAAWGQVVFEGGGKIDTTHPLFKIA
jgi:tetrahydromethanopterin S-methyltransferase subunit H